MEVYQTDSGGFFVNTTEADQDPMDSSNWLIPAGCVEATPPEHTDMQQVRWDGSSWIVEDIPEVVQEPEPEPEDPAVVARRDRDGLLSRSDWTQLADAPIDQTAWAGYRSLLRGIPQQADFPDAIEWPNKPETL